MKLKFSAPIVGMRFRPPAAIIMGNLPLDAKLGLQREPNNPYDPNAIQVLLPLPWEDEHPRIVEAVREWFRDQEKSQEDCEEYISNPAFLGYIKKEIAETIAGQWDKDEDKIVVHCKLKFGVSGGPEADIELDFGDEAEPVKGDTSGDDEGPQQKTPDHALEEHQRTMAPEDDQ